MFTKISNPKNAADSAAQAPRARGRPPGQTTQGAAARRRLYKTAIKLIASKGYDATTLRDIADDAEVSVGLLYRYFPSKRAVVLALYDELSLDYAKRAASIPTGTWRQRFLEALKISMDVLGKQRGTISALVPLLVGNADEGLFSEATAFSRQRVEGVFHAAVLGSTDVPPSDDAASLARVLYVTHLAVLLWWLLDKSPKQRATGRLLALLESSLPLASVALRMKPARSFLQTADTVLREALFGEELPDSSISEAGT